MTAQNAILQGTAVGQIASPHGSWPGRNWKWLLLVAFLAVIVFALGVFALIMGGIRSSEVAKEALPSRLLKNRAEPAISRLV